MVTNEERREVAENLREETIIKEPFPIAYIDIPPFTTRKTIFGCFLLSDDGLKLKYALERLSELIEPEPKRTCKNDSNTGFLCSACSFGDFSSFTYKPKYCPNCGAEVIEDAEDN